MRQFRQQQFQGTEVLKTYLDKSAFADMLETRNLRTLSNAPEVYADKEIAERVFVITCKISWKAEPFDFGSIRVDFRGLPETWQEAPTQLRDFAPGLRRAVYPCLTTESIPLPTEQPGADDDDLRAFVVWRLGRPGYVWSDEEIERIVHDATRKLPVNAMFALGKESLEKFKGDENNVVLVAATVLTED